jgi:hypothetical protein
MPPVDGGSKNHWYLWHSHGSWERIVDPTVHQFAMIPEYWRGRGCGFLTKKPSKKAQKIIDAVEALKAGAV